MPKHCTFTNYTEMFKGNECCSTQYSAMDRQRVMMWSLRVSLPVQVTHSEWTSTSCIILQMRFFQGHQKLAFVCGSVTAQEKLLYCLSTKIPQHLCYIYIPNKASSFYGHLYKNTSPADVMVISVVLISDKH